MSANLSTLSRVRLFDGLDEAALERLLVEVRERTFDAGQVISLEGEPCRAVYLIAEGWVRVRQFSAEGREHVLAHLGPGACLNLVPALDGGPDGLDLLRRAATGARTWLAPGGHLLSETALDQAAAAADALAGAGLEPSVVTDEDMGTTIVTGVR